MSSDHPERSTSANIKLLRLHLKDGTLAARLVDTYCDSNPEERFEKLKAIAETRLAEIRDALEREKTTNAPD